jgi:hypothetical protein
MPDGMGDPLRYSREAKIFQKMKRIIWVHISDFSKYSKVFYKFLNK